LLFDSASKTLQEIAADPKHLGARIGVLAVLHTWGQTLDLHPHLHCIVPGGDLSLDGQRWVSSRPDYFLRVQVWRVCFAASFWGREGGLRGWTVEATGLPLICLPAKRVIHDRPSRRR
jgi:hypothetical protein